MRNFREYDVWKKGISFTAGMYIRTSDFPDREKFGLVSQIRRASVSIPSNIAEGCSRASEKDFARFIEIALGSAFETETLLIIGKEAGFLNKDQFDLQIDQLHGLQRGLNTLYGKLKGRK